MFDESDGTDTDTDIGTDAGADRAVVESVPGRAVVNGSMSSRGIALAAMLFAFGLTIGVLGGIVLFGGDAASETAESASCGDANSVVDESLAAIADINESEIQNASFFASLLVEQREITFAMEAAPQCFSLEDRAGAAGLLLGIEGLLAASEPLAVAVPPSSADE